MKQPKNHISKEHKMRKLISKISFFYLIILTVSCGSDDEGSAPQPILSLTDLAITVAENPEVNTVIGSFTLVQENLQTPVSFEITEESVPGALDINSQGELLIANATLFDFEVNTMITGTVRVVSGMLTDTANFTIAITDVNEVVPFITRWNLPASDLTIHLPIYEGNIDDETLYDFTVDWGDGTSGEVTSFDDPDAFHTYTTEGEKTVTITGVLRGFSFGEIVDSRLSFTDVVQWGSVALGNAGGHFSECQNLTGFSATDVPDLSEVTNISFMFFNDRNFNSDLSNWDVSNVTDMRETFSFATTFNSDLSNWNVSNVTNLLGTFDSAQSFNSDLSNWDVSNVVTMFALLRNTSFDGDISNWDVSNVVNMVAMFSGARDFNGDISDWDVSSVTNMRFMFSNATSFNGDLSNWNVSNVTDMLAMFTSAPLFNSDISNWDVSSVINMGGMFAGASSFNEDISNWDVSNVRNMNLMFSNAFSFNQDLSDWPTDNVTTCDNFGNGSLLTPANLPTRGPCF